MGHMAKACPQLNSSKMTVNCAGTSDGQENKWLIDSAASHNITGDIKNLSIHSSMMAPMKSFLVMIGLAVTHIGSLALPTPKKSFIYMILYARSTGAILLRGACENGIYIFPNSMVAPSTPKMVAYVHERTSIDGWHKCLGHPSIKPPPSSEPGCKWVFRVKRKADGSLINLKSLVVKGYNQQPVLIITKPLVLCITIMNGWPLKQMDVNNAFYMEIENCTCNLWSQTSPKGLVFKIKIALLALGFQISKVDSSLLFIAMIPFHYGNDKKFVAHVVTKLGDQFSLKDMGSFIPSLEWKLYQLCSVFLSQHKYVRDILENTHMAGTKDVSTHVNNSIPSLGVLLATYNTFLLLGPTFLLLLISSLNLCTSQQSLIGSPLRDFFDISRIQSFTVFTSIHKGAFKVSYVHTQDQLVDLLTKPLSRERTECLRAKIGLIDGSSILGRLRKHMVYFVDHILNSLFLRVVVRSQKPSKREPEWRLVLIS
ncbi:hypothetical protein AAG906_012333 [Vitis piasezkii]